MNLSLAILAGAASAVMFASVISGAMISLLLVSFAPLPLMVVALGWGSANAAIGALVAALGLGLTFGLALGGVFHFQYVLAFLVSAGVPAVWLGHLCLLAQPAASTAHPDASQALEWYPMGRLLVWLAVFGSLIPMIGWDADATEASFRQLLTKAFAARNAGATASDVDWMINFIVGVAPAVSAIVCMSILVLNLWLAGRIVRTSGRLRRPWPDLRGVEVPRSTLIVLAVALALSLTGGMLAASAKMVTGAFLAAHMMVGFAVLHVVTGSMMGRSIWLGLAYASIPFFWWPAVPIALLGLFEDVFGIRRRFHRPPQQPPAASL